jgi:hypothetical protein
MKAVRISGLSNIQDPPPHLPLPPICELCLESMPISTTVRHNNFDFSMPVRIFSFPERCHSTGIDRTPTCMVELNTDFSTKAAPVPRHQSQQRLRGERLFNGLLLRQGLFSFPRNPRLIAVRPSAACSGSRCPYRAAPWMRPTLDRNNLEKLKHGSADSRR